MVMPAPVRKFVLTVHIVVSVGWIGAVAAYLVLDVTVAATQEVNTLRAAYVSMDLITKWAILPLAYATVASGLVISLGTKWGLFRHYWVIVSLVLTVFALVVLLVEAKTIGSLADVASDANSSEADVRNLPGTLPHSIGGLVVLLLVTWLNMYKPPGLTAYGWRKHRESLEAMPRR